MKLRRTKNGANFWATLYRPKSLSYKKCLASGGSRGCGQSGHAPPLQSGHGIHCGQLILRKIS